MTAFNLLPLSTENQDDARLLVQSVAGAFLRKPVGAVVEGELLSNPPSWLASTPPVVGNGAIACVMLRRGRMLQATITVIFGSTTTAGSGEWTFKLPAPFDGPAAITAIGSALARDSAGGTNRVGAAVILPGENVIRIYPHGAANTWRSNSPHAWAAGDRLDFTIQYRLT